MRIVLDTNVIISAFFWKGNERKLLDKCRAKEVELVISPNILEEIDVVLDSKFSVRRISRLFQKHYIGFKARFSDQGNRCH